MEVRALRVLLVLLAPATLEAQERATPPAPLIAAAIKEALSPARNAAEIRATLAANGVSVPESAPRTFKVSRAFYTFERRTRFNTPPTLPSAVRAPTDSPSLAFDIATRLGFVTTADAEAEPKACGPVRPTPSGRRGAETVCRYAHTDGVVAGSVPVVSGDTARVDVMIWVNHSQATRGINFQVMEVTLVRSNGVWTPVSRRSVATVHR